MPKIVPPYYTHFPPGCKEGKTPRRAGNPTGCLLFRPLHAAGIGILPGPPVQQDALIEAVAAGEVIAVIPILGQNPAGQIAAQAALAHHVDGFARGNLPQMVPQLIQRDIHKALRAAAAVLPGGPGVQQGYAAVPGQPSHVLPVELLHHPLLQVFRHESHQIHRVLG